LKEETSKTIIALESYILKQPPPPSRKRYPKTFLSTPQTVDSEAALKRLPRKQTAEGNTRNLKVRH